METITEPTPVDTGELKKQALKRLLSLLIFFGLCILLPAGTFNYWQAYLYLIILILPMLFALNYFLRKDPEFLERRMRLKEKEQQQKAVQWVFLVFFLATFIIIGLDRRYGWSDVPLFLVLLTDAIILSGYLVILVVFNQNRFASRIVEIDENQSVISTGLYSIVRHPMYFGFLFMYLPTPLALGSYWGLIPIMAILPPLIFRIKNEEKVLREGLPGYIEYCNRTKYRLIPFIW
jgi:protein-S-isoprenylcysteine O-methyltransferase Ste14